MLGGSAGIANRQAITFNHNQVGQINSTDQTNFPVVFSGAYSYLATVANGGKVINTTTLNGQTVPADLTFTSDAAGTTLLNWEVASYNATTGAIEVWIKIPTLSHSANTIIYMQYGNAAITTYQGAATSVWDSNFYRVYHLANGTTLSVNDSTSNAGTGGNNSASPAVSGEIDGGVGLNGTNQAIDFGTFRLANATPGTFEAWISSTAYNGGTIGYEAATQNNLSLNFPSTSTGVLVANVGSNTPNFSGVKNNFALNTFYHTVLSWDGTNVKIYVNGVLDSSTASTNLTTTSTDKFRIGSFVFGGGATTGGFLSGTMDEARVSAIARSADWINTEYLNQSSPSTFYTVAGY